MARIARSGARIRPQWRAANPRFAQERAQSLGATRGPDRVAEAMLNHAEANVLIATYDKRDLLAEKIDAMNLWCGAIEAALRAERRPQTALRLGRLSSPA